MLSSVANCKQQIVDDFILLLIAKVKALFRTGHAPNFLATE
jgi:hypothetical protein